MPKPKIQPAKSVAAATKTARRGSTLTKQEQEALAEDGRKALAAIELHTEELTRASRMTRESWLAYSRVLMTFRDSLPDEPTDRFTLGQSKSNQAYGRWVRDNKLNVGLAKSASVRSNALWLARTWPEIEAVLQRLQHELSLTHPTAIRRWWLSGQQANDRGDVHFGAGPASYHEIRDQMHGLRLSVETLSSTVKNLEADHVISADRFESAREAMREMARLWEQVEAHLKAHPELIATPAWEKRLMGLE